MAELAQTWSAGAAALPSAGNPEALELHLGQWRDAAAREDAADLAAFAAGAADDPAAAALLRAVFGNSTYLSRSLIADLSFARLLLERGPDEAFAATLSGLKDGAAPGPPSRAEITKGLRVAKRRAALAIGMADIASAWPLEKVTGALSDLAGAALSAACRFLLGELHAAGRLELPHPEDPERGSGLIVLGMGKLGARELNYSSDIDLIILYDQDRLAGVDEDRVQQVFTRFARNLVALLDERTADGYVFRTDLRLRPDPGSTAPALSVRAAEMYYESAGQNWERAAMIKAQPVAGDIERGLEFLDYLRPFMWRRHLDFAAIQDIHSIKRQINAHRGSSAIAIAGHNVKLGRGGIREIEFFAQTQQLIWGGRDPRLRVRGTVEALDRLVATGQVERRTADELKEAYAFLRRLEHRLQMVDDRQTHSVPEDAGELARFAAFAGHDSVDGFSAALLARLQTVERHYARLFEDEPDLAGPGNLVFTGGDHDPETLETIAGMGYEDAERVSSLVRAWHAGRYRSTRSTRARELLTELVPAVLEAFSGTLDPDAAILRFDQFLARLPAGLQVFSVFMSNPGLLGLVAEIMGSAPGLAEWLSRRPVLLDSVLGRDFSDLELPDSEDLDAEVADEARRGLIRLYYAREFGLGEMAGELAVVAGEARDLQDFMDLERRWAHDRVFRLGVHMLRGLFAPAEAGQPLSDIAQSCLVALLPFVEREFAERHGRIAGGRIALLALGKLGSRELTVGSDLDLLFVYDHDPACGESDGGRPLAPSQYYAQLCRRFISAVTSPTADGKLYEVDMRLRPTGNSGAIATSFESFARYQEVDAWTWEHQALTRARVLHAEGDLGERLDGVIRGVLTQERDPEELALAVTGMRERIWRERGGGDPWDVKHMRGGLVDVEFIAQFLQLRHGAASPEILLRDPAAVFEAAGRRRLIDPGAAEGLAAAALLWRNLQGILRLTVGGELDEDRATPGLRRAIARACGIADFGTLKGVVADTAVEARRQFESLVGPVDEGEASGDALRRSGGER